MSIPPKIHGSPTEVLLLSSIFQCFKQPKGPMQSFPARFSVFLLVLCGVFFTKASSAQTCSGYFSGSITPTHWPVGKTTSVTATGSFPSSPSCYYSQGPYEYSTGAADPNVTITNLTVVNSTTVTFNAVVGAADFS